MGKCKEPTSLLTAERVAEKQETTTAFPHQSELLTALLVFSASLQDRCSDSSVPRGILRTLLYTEYRNQCLSRSGPSLLLTGSCNPTITWARKQGMVPFKSITKVHGLGEDLTLHPEGLRSAAPQHKVEHDDTTQPLTFSTRKVISLEESCRTGAMNSHVTSTCMIWVFPALLPMMAWHSSRSVTTCNATVCHVPHC